MPSEHPAIQTLKRRAPLLWEADGTQALRLSAAGTRNYINDKEPKINNVKERSSGDKMSVKAET